MDGERRRGLLRDARLYLVTDGDVDAVREAIAGGVDLVQLRMKDAPDERVLETARAFREACPLLIVNDRPDLALACGADGVHVGQDDIALDEARTVVGGDLIVGVSTHSPEQVDAALDSTADYLGVGPVYSTPTKPGREPVGLELVRYAASHASAKPWFAIGGIDQGNARAVADAGATRIAVVRAIRDAADPRAAAAALKLEEARVD